VEITHNEMFPDVSWEKRSFVTQKKLIKLKLVFEKLSVDLALAGQVVEVASFRSNNEPLFISGHRQRVLVKQHLCSNWGFVGVTSTLRKDVT